LGIKNIRKMDLIMDIMVDEARMGAIRDDEKETFEYALKCANSA
jgi:hypothetical protein